ncbi:MAG: FAD-dependent oxidoreductase [Gemmataceae bacterium]
MNRRAFLSLSAVTPLASWLPAFAADPVKSHELSADVVIIGAGVGGVAAALAAARGGCSVLLTEEMDWIGGQLTSQAVPPDEHPWIEELGCTRSYRKFRNGVREFYRRHYPLSDAAKKAKALNPGNGSVSKLCHEPRVAVAVLLEMLAPFLSKGLIRMLQPVVPVSAVADGDRVKAVTVAHKWTNNETVLTAKYFVDATEYGDLLRLAKVESVTGAESQKDTGEPNAKAKAEPHNEQAVTSCFAISYHEDEDHTIPKPDDYKNWAAYVPKMAPAWPGPLLSWRMSQYNEPTKVRSVGFRPTGPTEKGVLNLWTYRRILDRTNLANDSTTDICLVNWPQNDYWLAPLSTATGDARVQRTREAKQLSLSLLYWMQTEAPRPDGKTGWKGLKLRPDIVGTDDGLAMALYVREARRIKAEFTVCEQHVGTTARTNVTGKMPGEVTAEPFADSVGIGSYRIDLHPSTGGDNYIDVSSLPFQIPLGCLLPVRVENLLPACKNIGTTHITNGCYRLHPVEWNIGEAVGSLLAFAIAKKELPRQVRSNQKRLVEFQSLLVKQEFELKWPAEIAVKAR